MSERAIKAGIVRMLRDRGAYVVVTHGTAYGVVGVPDLLVCLNGQFLGLEVKTPVGRATVMQERQLAEIVKAGGIGSVVRSVAEAETLTGKKSYEPD